MIRAGDLVWLLDQKGRRVEGAPRPVASVAAGLVTLRSNGCDVSYQDGQVEVSCHHKGCGLTAVAFVRSSGAAVCERCADQRYHAHELISTRGNEAAIVACVCGESLDGLPGVTWDVGGIACEYRTCGHCHSTRAYMPRDKLAGAMVTTGDEADSRGWESFLSALETYPAPGTELRRGRVVLARAYLAANGDQGWRVCAPQREKID